MSTAYSHCYKTHIDDVIYPPRIKYNELMDLVKWADVLISFCGDISVLGTIILFTTHLKHIKVTQGKWEVGGK